MVSQVNINTEIRINADISETVHKTEKKGTFPSSSIEAKIILILNPNKDTRKENCTTDNSYKYRKSITVIYHINRIEDKNHMIISIDIEKHCTKSNNFSQ